MASLKIAILVRIHISLSAEYRFVWCLGKVKKNILQFVFISMSVGTLFDKFRAIIFVLSINPLTQFSNMNLSELLNSPAVASVVANVSSQFGLDQKQASSAINTVLPVILEGLNKNASTPQGAESLNNALESKHNGSLLDNLGAILGGDQSALLQDGGGILGHIFGSQLSGVTAATAQKTGIGTDKMGSIFAMLAPVVMAYLGKQKATNQVNAGGLGDMLGGLLGGGSQQKSSGGLQGMVTGLLDKDKDGNVVDDILDMFFKK